MIQHFYGQVKKMAIITSIYFKLMEKNDDKLQKENGKSHSFMDMMMQIKFYIINLMKIRH